jgi:NAD(P)-dependent dehydrogenase (short-subunit alcohol dehydrogenase family)
MGKLDGRVALITGAGRGIGAAVAETMAAEGAAVVVNDLGATLDGSGQAAAGPAEEVAERIRKAGGRALADTSDVTSFAATEKMVARTVEEFGRLDVLVNVAGIIRDGMIFKMTEEQFDAVLQVHLKGTFNTTRHASVWWRENRGGHYRLINFISGSGLYGSPVQPNYAAAKMGIVGLTYSCASALTGYGVTSNCIAPVAYTRMTASLQGKSTVMDYSPDNPKISAANVVPPVIYLASEHSEWINGRILAAGNGRISLFNSPAIEREVVKDGVWTLDEAFTEMEGAFKEAIVYPNPFRRPRA